MALDLKRKVGPLPLWGWLGLGGVAGLYLYERNKTTASTSSTAATPAATDSGTVAPDQGAGDWSGLGGGGGITSPPDQGSPSTGGGSSQPDYSGALAALTAAIQGLGAAPASGVPNTPASPVGSAAPSGVPVNQLPIRTQLQQYAAGNLTRAQLGPNARKVLNAAGGNARKAIASRSVAASTAHTAAANGPATRAVATAIRTTGGHLVTIANTPNGVKSSARAPTSHSVSVKRKPRR